jgi:hypothetical protein
MYFNYILLPIVSVLGSILPKNLYVIFSGGNKIYDRQSNPGSTFTYTISGIVNNENIYVISFNSNYNSVFVGDNRIDISNLYIGGITIGNYILMNIKPVYATISKRSAGYGISNANKIYDTTNILSTTASEYFVNTIQNDYILTYPFSGYYDQVNVGNQKIILTKYGFYGIDSINYNFYLLSSSGQIFPKQIFTTFTGGTKIYNQDYNTGTIYGFFHGYTTETKRVHTSKATDLALKLEIILNDRSLVTLSSKIKYFESIFEYLDKIDNLFN